MSLISSAIRIGGMAKRTRKRKGTGVTIAKPDQKRRIPMKHTFAAFCLSTVLLLFMGCSVNSEADNQKAEPSIRGAWTIESMDVGIGENRRTTVPKAFMIFILEKHYSAIRDFSPKPVPGEELSPASSGAFMADAGTYEFDGTDLVVHHMAAMFPSLGSMTFGCSLEGANTLILTPQYDKMVMPGVDMAPSPDGKMGYGDMAVLYRFKRLE